MSWTKSRLVKCIGNRRLSFWLEYLDCCRRTRRDRISLGSEGVFKLGSRVCVISSGALVVGTVVRCLGTGAEH
jgi:hypothetical protein